MRTTPSEQALPYECFAEEQLDVFLGPLPCWQGLQEHHDFLKVHFSELVGPFDEEGGADVEMERGEPIFFGLQVVSTGK
jgi:hypothetical protein